MSKPWTVRELEDETIDEYSADELPGIPYGFEKDDIRNFVVENGGYGFVGGADLMERDGFYALLNCELDEDMRGKRYEGESPFGDLIEARLSEADGEPVRTDAVTDHGKTQYKMSQYGFQPTLLDPHPSPHSTPFIGMWKGEFGNMITELPQEHTETIDESQLDVETLETDGEPAGLDYELIKPFQELDEGLHIYRVRRGDRSPEELVDEIVDKNESSENYAVDVVASSRLPEVEDVARGLEDEGFSFFGFRPPVEESGEVHFGKFNRKMYGVSATEETLDFLDELGLDYRVTEEGEKSSEVTILP